MNAGIILGVVSLFINSNQHFCRIIFVVIFVETVFYPSFLFFIFYETFDVKPNFLKLMNIKVTTHHHLGSV